MNFKRRRIWLDTEFIEDGRTIDLISIGAVREDGFMFYAVAEGIPWEKASKWVLDNVRPMIDWRPCLNEIVLMNVSREIIADAFLKFCINGNGIGPEFWAYYGAYDWVALCQLYGTMMDLPHGWPMYCNDLKQYCNALGNPRLPEQTVAKHNALADAMWTKETHLLLNEYEAKQLRLRGIS